MEWQPIATAPKDGTRILTWGCLHDDSGIDMGESPRVELTKFSDVYHSWVSEEIGSHEPTHWMPLPKPPTAQRLASRCTPAEALRVSSAHRADTAPAATKTTPRR